VIAFDFLGQATSKRRHGHDESGYILLLEEVAELIAVFAVALITLPGFQYLSKAMNILCAGLNHQSAALEIAKSSRWQPRMEERSALFVASTPCRGCHSLDLQPRGILPAGLCPCAPSIHCKRYSGTARALKPRSISRYLPERAASFRVAAG